MSEPTYRPPNPNAPLIAGMVICVVMIVAYVWAESQGVRTGPILNLVMPIVATTMVVPGIRQVQQTTEKVARQTNGHLTELTASRDRVTADRDRLAAENAQLLAALPPELIPENLPTLTPAPRLDPPKDSPQ